MYHIEAYDSYFVSSETPEQQVYTARNSCETVLLKLRPDYLLISTQQRLQTIATAKVKFICSFQEWLPFSRTVVQKFLHKFNITVFPFNQALHPSAVKPILVEEGSL